MAAVRELQAHHHVAGRQQGVVDGGVGLRTGVGLDVGVLGAEQRQLDAHVAANSSGGVGRLKQTSAKFNTTVAPFNTAAPRPPPPPDRDPARSPAPGIPPPPATRAARPPSWGDQTPATAR